MVLGRSILSRPKRVKVKNVVFAFRENTGDLAIVSQELVAARKVRGANVKNTRMSISVTQEILFQNSKRVIDGVVRKFWLMPLSRSSEEKIGSDGLQWCDEPETIGLLKLDRRETELLREARAAARKLVPRRIEDCV